MSELRFLEVFVNVDDAGNVDEADAGLPPLVQLPNLEYISLGQTLVSDFSEMMFRDDVRVNR
jgi:hypothetical protein